MAGVEREGLAMLDAEKPHSFLIPTKKINDGEDLDFFLSSIAYTDLMKFLLQLNHAMIPRRSPKGPVVHTIQSTRETWDETVQKLGQLISDLTSLIDEAPPDPGPRRFGNISFRKWHAFVEERLPALLNTYLPSEVTNFQNGGGSPSAVDEIQAYLLGSFGSAQRLDFGTGHELSFLAFIACIWKLGGFKVKQDGEQERGIVLGIIDPYLTLIKKLVLTYTLEPAGSHGVWGLDDHFFLPYIFGSAQLSQAINPSDPTPIEGSVLDAPLPRDVTNKRVVEEQRTQHMYFEAIGFIYDVKRGPFWEHSPVLHDISGITAGWGKINKGMLKMFNAEVLSKFPVVQHFPFGSLFKWVRDPLAAPVNVSTHAANQPKAAPRTTLPPMSTTVFPSVTSSMPSTNLRRPDNLPPVALPPPGPNGMPTTRAPWASNTGRPTPSTQPPSTRMPPPTSMRRPPPP